MDGYRYWRVEAIVADLDRRRHSFHVAIENLGHDFNIGSIVRTANAFLAAEVHVVGRRRCNRRGAHSDWLLSIQRTAGLSPGQRIVGGCQDPIDDGRTGTRGN